jgi:hypothetical protein
MLPRSWDTAAAALWACARALGDSRALGEVAAASGLAFRLSVDAQVTLAGPHAYPWREELSLAAERLGYACEVVASPPSEPPGAPLHGTAVERALALIDRGQAAGRPTLVWGIHAPEFGLALGRDGDALRVSGLLDGIAAPTLPARELGRGDVPAVFALQLVGRIATLPPETTLRSALEHARGPTPTLAGFFTGQAAWRALAQALETGQLDPAGLAYTAQRLAESRAHAAAWLAALDDEWAAARAGFRRAAGMLAELAGLLPFPPPPGAMLVSSTREQAHSLVEEATRAEGESLDAIARALDARVERRRDSVAVVDVTRPAELFACVGDLPVPLAAEADDCRGRAIRGKLLRDGDRTLGQLLWAPLEEAAYPIYAEGRRWLIFCSWVAHSERGRRLGSRLFAVLVEEARSAGIDGLLTLCTDDERFLYPACYARWGFTEVDGRGGTHLMELALTETPSRARLREPPPAPTGGALPVRVRHGYNCPLLLHTRRAVEKAAREAGAALDSADASQTEPAGVTIGGKALLHGFVPLQALTAALKQESERWS